MTTTCIFLQGTHIYITTTRTWNGSHVNTNAPVIKNNVLDSLASLLALTPFCMREDDLSQMTQEEVHVMSKGVDKLIITTVKNW